MTTDCSSSNGTASGFGVDSTFKRLYVLDLAAPDEEGFVSKHHAVNLMWIANPDGIGDMPEDGFGLGPVFAFPLESVETLLVLGDGRLLVANDNNYPGGNGRIPGTPDDTEMIILSTVTESTPPSTAPSASAPPTTGN